MDVGQEVSLVVIGRDDVADELAKIEPNRDAEATGKMVLHKWRSGKTNLEACILELTEVSHARQ
jgi:hypothetical protein